MAKVWLEWSRAGAAGRELSQQLGCYVDGASLQARASAVGWVYLGQKVSALHKLIITSAQLLQHGFAPLHLLQVERAVTALPSSPPNSGVEAALA